MTGYGFQREAHTEDLPYRQDQALRSARRMAALDGAAPTLEDVEGGAELLAACKALIASLDCGTLTLRHTEGLSGFANEHYHTIKAAILKATETPDSDPKPLESPSGTDSPPDAR